MDKLLSTKQTANRLGIHPESVRLLIKRGQLKATKLGGNGTSRRHWRIKETDLEAFVNGNHEGL